MIRFARGALAAVDEALDYSERNWSTAEAEQLRRRIETTLARLERFPETGRIGRVEGTREVLVLNTPYIVAYRYVNDDVEVLAFRHSSRKWPTHF